MNEISNKIFQAKHWQIFLTAVVLSFLQEIAIFAGDFFDTLLYLISVLSYIGWLLFLGSRLWRTSQNPQLNYQLFLCVGYILMAFLISFRLLGLFNPVLLKAFEDTTVLLLTMAYLLISLIILTSFVAKNLKVIEVGNDIDINDYFGDIFGLIFWPIGIWTFQPRINKLAERLASR
jgi:hypothetical protein